MTSFTWVSVGALAVFLSVYLYWSWLEERAHPARVRDAFLGGIALFGVLFLVFTWDTLRTLPARTHAELVTAQVVAGKRVWQKYVCIDCHTILGNGAYFAPDLTKVWDRFLDRAGGDPAAARTALVAFLENPPRATRDRRGMPDYGMTKEEARELVAFLEWVSKIDTNGWPPPPSRPLVARLSNGQGKLSAAGQEGRRVFVAEGCDACHSVGAGMVVGPDLAEAADKYDAATLLRWIKDPETVYRERGHKPLNPGYPEMPGLNVPATEARALVVYLQEAAGKE